MSKMFYKFVSLGHKSKNCTEQEILFLIEIFRNKVKSTAVSCARRAFYELEDFYNAKDWKVDNFSLTIERNPTDKDAWFGFFESHCKTKTLRTSGLLVKN